MHGVFDLRCGCCGQVRGDLIFRRGCLGCRLRIHIINCGAEFTTAVGMTVWIVCIHRHAEKVCEVGYSDGAIGPGTISVDCVFGVGGLDAVRIRAVAVVAQIVTERYELAERVFACAFGRTLSSGYGRLAR